MQIFSTFSPPKIKGTTKIQPYASLAPVSAQPKPAGYTQEQVNASLAANPRAGLSNLPENAFSALRGVNPASPGSASKPQPPSSQNVFDLSTDPIVQRIRALNTQDYSGAVGSADEQRKQLLIRAGFGDLARAAQFGSLEAPATGDQATALAAEQNPNSIARQLARAHESQQQGIDVQANRENLFSSSTRANRLGDEARGYLSQQADAQDQIRQALADIISNLVTARSSQRQREADALAQARASAIEQALQSGQMFLGYDANGNPIFGQQPAVTAGDYFAANPLPQGTSATDAVAALNQFQPQSYLFSGPQADLPIVLPPTQTIPARRNRASL